jgi:hypothetical protein
MLSAKARIGGLQNEKNKELGRKTTNVNKRLMSVFWVILTTKERVKRKLL